MRNYYSAIAKGYEGLHEEEQLQKLKVIKENIQAKPLILDLGCGTGLSKKIFKKTKTVYLDSSLEMLKRFKSSLRVCAIAEALPFKSKTFSTIISVTSIHNFKNVDKAINEIRRVSKRGTFFAVTILKKSKNFGSIKKEVSQLNIFKEVDEEKDLIIIGKKS